MAEKLTAEQVIEAIEATYGNVTMAAKRLGVHRRTLYNYRDRYVTVERAMEDSREELIDFTESKLLEQIRGGNLTAMIFFLKTQAKHRGYVERQERHHSGEPFDPRSMTDEELEAVVNGEG